MTPATRLLTATLLSLALLSSSCPEKPGRQFAEYTTGLGLGISLGDDRTAVQAALGQPVSSTEREAFAEDYYVPGFQGSTPPMPDLSAPQLTLMYVDRRLVRIYNHYSPADPAAPVPTFIAEPASGAKLGNRRSQFEAALGPGNHGPLNDAWRFTSDDGRAVVIQAEFVEVPSLGNERICGTLSVALEDETVGKGEFYDKRRERNEAIHNL